MAGFIVLQDGRAYAASNWAYDLTVERIAVALPPTPQGVALRTWLLGQRCGVLGPGLGSVDLRGLTPDNQRLVEAAARGAVEAAERSGPGGLGVDQETYSGWLSRLHDLLEMFDSIRRGEPPSVLNPHMIDVIPPTGDRVGPGWEE
jgi:hypothetical protein